MSFDIQDKPGTTVKRVSNPDFAHEPDLFTPAPSEPKLRGDSLKSSGVRPPSERSMIAAALAKIADNLGPSLATAAGASAMAKAGAGVGAVLGPADASAWYQVKKGDTISMLAKSWGVSVSDLRAANPHVFRDQKGTGLKLRDVGGNHIYEGERLRVPVKRDGSAATTAPVAKKNAVKSDSDMLNHADDHKYSNLEEETEAPPYDVDLVSVLPPTGPKLGESRRSTPHTTITHLAYDIIPGETPADFKFIAKGRVNFDEHARAVLGSASFLQKNYRAYALDATAMDDAVKAGGLPADAALSVMRQKMASRPALQDFLAQHPEMVVEMPNLKAKLLVSDKEKAPPTAPIVEPEEPYQYQGF